MDKTKEFEAVKEKLEMTEAQARMAAEQAKGDVDAKIYTLRDQMTQAADRQKAQIEKRIAEVRADHAALSAEPEQARLGENAKEVTLGMAVLGIDGKAGSLERVVGDPGTDEPAYLVVRLAPVPQRDALVPVNLVADVTAAGLKLNATTGALQAFPDYEKVVRSYQPLTAEEREQVMPALVFDPELDLATVTVRERTVPEHMVDLRKGMTVYDSAGLKLGEIEGVIADADKKQISHVVMRVANPFMEEFRLVPVDLLDFTIRSDVYLVASSRDIAGLPLYKPGQ